MRTVRDPEAVLDVLVAGLHQGPAAVSSSSGTTVTSQSSYDKMQSHPASYTYCLPDIGNEAKLKRIKDRITFISLEMMKKISF